MEEDRQFTRLLIQRTRDDIIALFDKAVEELDNYKWAELPKRKYHSKFSMITASRNLGAALCRVRAATNFTIKMMNSLRIHLNYRIEKAAILNKTYEKLRQEAYNKKCNKGKKDERIFREQEGQRDIGSSEGNDGSTDG